MLENKNERMDVESISMLAELLRKTGDKVLQGDKTLLLNETLLKSLNDSFKFLAEEQDSDASFQVTKTNNSKESIFHDIQFLHDFIQKVLHISVARDTTRSVRNFILDINKFKSLQSLELTKIPVRNVTGIEQVRTQLQCVVCVQGLLQLQDLLVNCGADHSAADVWEELVEVVFTYNALGAIDNSFMYTPALQTIDLSHNRLKNFCVEDSLPNLKYLNLNFNLLQSVPSFGKEGACKLKTLLLRNNYLTDLSDLFKLKQLVELDLSCNSLTDHSTLVPVRKLPLLCWLNLAGNPLSFHIKHRSHTVHHLHVNASRCKFVLDGRALSWKERKSVRHHGIEVMDYSEEELLLSTESVASFPEEEYSTPVVQIQSKKSSRSRRQRSQVKEAVISESLKEQEVIPNNPSTADDQQHLQVKRDIEQLRQRFGEEHWLSEHGAAHLQAVLGLPRISPPSLVETLACHFKTQIPIQSENTSTSQEDLQNSLTSQLRNEIKNELSNIDSDNLAVDEQHQKLDSSEEWEQGESEQDQINYSQSEEEDVDESKLFTVRNTNASSQLLLLAVSASNLQERDVKSGRVLQKWSLASLQSCELLSDSQSTVRLTFNVMRRDRRSRMYLAEPSEAKELVHVLGDVLASRTLSDMNQVAYRCMKCSSQFSHEEDVQHASRGSTILCPSCGSSIVCMMEEVPLPSRIMPGTVSVGGLATSSAVTAAPAGPSLSSSQSSIGSKDNCPVEAPGSTRDCCLQVAAVVHQADAPSVSPSCPSPPRASPMASAPALTRSAVSLEESCSAISTRRCDSDIEVISNPSQSSIEVLDGGSRTPGRKCSSEERQTAVVCVDVNIRAVSSPVIASVGLTESSSSGSFTDSICTTYETQKNVTNGSGAEDPPAFRLQNGVETSKMSMEKPAVEMEDDSLYGTEPIPSLQEMFEGLLEKVDKELAISDGLKSITSVVDNSIQYSYSDFQQVDHRLRLYFLQELLESDEELLLAEILKTGNSSPFPGLTVFSSTRVWVLQIIGTEGDNPETWLQENTKFPLLSVNAIFPLLWEQGIGVECKELDWHILMLLQDSQRTHNFLRAAESALPTSCGIIHESACYQHQFMDKVANFRDSTSQLQLVSIFDSFDIKGEKDSAVKHGVVVVRTADIFVTESNLSWLFPHSLDNSIIKAVAAQQISDLMEVVTDECQIGLHFVDETKHKEEVWSLVFQTPTCAQAVVMAVRTPWEQLFSVPLQVTEGSLH
ncbi:Serine/threonine kinase 11-interacting protein [Gryllus bimaculatus]|nr:Serine/threonine kinase 11-interacting protein [Gryllus bimaculatus]